MVDLIGVDTTSMMRAKGKPNAAEVKDTRTTQLQG